MLKIKRESALKYKAEFEAEEHQKWYEMLMGQTESACGTFEEFQQKMKRDIYVAKK